MTSLRTTCPGRGQSRPFACTCGATVYRYRGYETTAKARLYNVADGTIHEHAAPGIPDMIECVCGVQVYRDPSGKRNMDGKAHVCARPVIMPLKRVQPVEDKTPTPEARRRVVNVTMNHAEV